MKKSHYTNELIVITMRKLGKLLSLFNRKHSCSFETLSFWRNPNSEIRINVTNWLAYEKIEGQYIEYPKSILFVFNYVKRFGLIAVYRKIQSRLSESQRNQKIGGVGFGFISEELTCNGLKKGLPVIFFSPNTYTNLGDVTIPVEFVVPYKKDVNSTASMYNSQMSLQLSPILRRYLAWSPFSGIDIDFAIIQAELQSLARNIEDLVPDPGYSLQEAKTRYSKKFKKTRKPSAVLFGLGNYAKTQIIPNVTKLLSFERIHEIDPKQLQFFAKDHSAEITTSPIPIHDRVFDAWFIAGYHHTHTDLAIEAIKQGAYAVIEKPLSTNKEQLSAFLSTLDYYPDARFFLCFHKRYSIFNSFIRSDFEAGAVDMHAIVYEIPLPANHWYNWPNSGSRLISNGCHWIDYFMFINNYSPAIHFDRCCPKGSDMLVRVCLENGAYLNLSLTEAGSQRLGMREYTELRQGGVTVSIIDGYHYVSEKRNKILKKRKINRLEAYSRMYQEISRKIGNGDLGDSRVSLRSSELTIHLEKSIPSFTQS